MPNPERTAAIGNVLITASQNAASLAKAGTDRSAFDVWTHSYEGMSARMQAFADDPVGALSSHPSWRPADAGVGMGTYWASDAAIEASLAAQEEGLGTKLKKILDAQGAPQTVDATFELLTGMEQMLSTVFSALPFPALPAIRIMDMDVGLPHAHAHPPNLIPPAPPVPLPSTGPIIPIPLLSGAARTLINGMPAARCGDLGLAVWCGGYFPMYEVSLGSSSVWIEGARAGRLGLDITKHCMFSAPKPSDPPLGPLFGMTIMASGNVLIGGVPMPSLLGYVIGAAVKKLMKGLAKVRPGRPPRAKPSPTSEAPTSSEGPRTTGPSTPPPDDPLPGPAKAPPDGPPPPDRPPPGPPPGPDG